jgi:hypothetical protein
MTVTSRMRVRAPACGWCVREAQDAAARSMRVAASVRFSFNNESHLPPGLVAAGEELEAALCRRAKIGERAQITGELRSRRG